MEKTQNYQVTEFGPNQPDVKQRAMRVRFFTTSAVTIANKPQAKVARIE